MKRPKRGCLGIADDSQMCSNTTSAPQLTAHVLAGVVATASRNLSSKHRAQQQPRPIRIFPLWLMSILHTGHRPCRCHA